TGAPFVQFTYAMLPPIPKELSGVRAESSELIWMNLPPARVWVYRGGVWCGVIARESGAADADPQNSCLSRVDTHGLAQCPAGGSGGQKDSPCHSPEHPT